MIYIYLILLMIAPQLWLEFMQGVHVDYFLYPAWFIVIGFRWRLNRVFSFKTIDLVFLAMLGWFLLSIMVNPKATTMNKIIIDYIKFFMMYRLTIASIDNFGKFKNVIYFLFILSFILTFESIQHKFSPNGLGWAGQTLGWADEAIVHASGSGRTRWINIFDGPGVFCVIFTNILPFVLIYFDKHFRAWQKMAAAVFIMPLLIAIYYTGSRGGFLATLVILFCYLITRVKLSVKKILLGLLLISAIFALAPSYLTSTHDKEHSAQHRVDMWAQGIEMVTYNPIFGIGKGNYKKYTGQLIAHNSAIQTMGETGLPGLFLWSSLIFLSLKGLYCFWKSSEDSIEKSYAKATGISIIGYVASSMFVTLEYETFYFLLAIAVSLPVMKNTPNKYTALNISWVCAMIIIWLIILKIFVMLY